MMSLRQVTYALPAVLLCLASAQPVPRGPTPMSIAQARQALQAHVQTPDTGLQTEVVTDTCGEGHPQYVFHGDAWGRYSIDAVTGEKEIHHQRRSPVPMGAAPAALMPASELRQIAIDYVAARFPGYKPGVFEVVAADTITELEGNGYSVGFVCHAASGALLPSRCDVEIEADVGSVRSYVETAIPATISTTPAVSAEQAVLAGRAWLAANDSSDAYAGELLAPGKHDPVVDLRVRVDPFLNQTLSYGLSYNACWLEVDAQTGAVIGRDGWSGTPYAAKR